MDHTHTVRVLQCVQHTHHHLFGVALAECTVHLDDVAQGLTLHVLHHQIRQMLGLTGFGGDDLFARIVDVHDVRIVHLRHGMRLAAEAGEEDLVIGEIGAHDLHGHGTTQTRIKRHMHFGHATAADQLTELIAAIRQRGRHVVAHPCSFQSLLGEIWGLLATRRGIRPPVGTIIVSANCVC